MNLAKDDLPRSALALYIKLFCKKSGNKVKDKNILMAATKSWVSLNKSDKQQFLKKYDEYQTSIKKAFADYLATAEPYLKVKKKKEKAKAETQILEENNSIQNIETQHEELQIEQNQQDQSNIEQNDIYNTVAANTEDDNDTNHPLMENPNDDIDMEQNDQCPVVEPTPPRLITGRQLFEMMHENDVNLVWNKLSNKEKRRYSSAVLLIKKKYLLDYKYYLEHLSSEKLFHHYKSMVIE